ncbi:hypothetical protein BH24CHL8_BH24CHL8_11060 [soil metagenome]
MHLLRAAGRGAVAGTVATLAMSVPMLAASRLGLISRQAPEQITDRVLQRMGWARGVQSETARDTLAAGNHLAFGAIGGVCFALLARRVPRSVPPVAAGIAYALLIWTVSYAGWTPALRLMPPPEEDEPARPVLMVVAHVVYGAVLGALTPGRATTVDRAVPAQRADQAQRAAAPVAVSP